MTFDPARPRYTLPFAGQDYELLGTFGLIEAVEYATKAHIGQVAVHIVNGMPVSDLAKVISAILTTCGHKMAVGEAKDILWGKVGLVGDEIDTLRLHLYSFLSICLAPPSEREKKATNLGKTMGELSSPAVSPGSNTDASV